MRPVSFVVFIILLASCTTQRPGTADRYPSYSGIYPHLAMYNNEEECGTGAVVPWAGRLWVITYGPHLPFGSSDNLYEITPDLQQIVREESIGGTPANRMVHPESGQLFIGPYAVDTVGNVRTIPYAAMPGRHTGNARHLTDPSGKIYYGTMEEGFYEVDVNSLEVKTLYVDGNVTRKEGEMGQEAHLLPGAHGKGLYSGQGVLVYSNNGEATAEALHRFDVEAGVLAEWDGRDWTVVRRNQFVEVTGPGGIYGNPHPDTDPIWATGWDHKSVLLGVRDNGKWSFYRLPKASHSYDGAHGWNTEWPRIRNVGTPDRADYLMTMHGMFWQFPESFTSENSAGIRPGSAYLKVIGDYTRWQDQLVFGCDDAAHKEFLNKRTIKGNIDGPGQSNSNLWFTSLEKPGQLGPSTAEGAVWLSENIRAGEYSEPFLFAGWNQRSAWILNEGNSTADFTFETDPDGKGTWEALQTIPVEAGSSRQVVFGHESKGEWIRVKSGLSTKATVHFSYTDTSRNKTNDKEMFSGLAPAGEKSYHAGLLYGLGGDRRALGVLSGEIRNGRYAENGYYELDAHMNLVKKEDETTASFIREKFAIPTRAVQVDPSSVLVVDDKGRRWRFPLGAAANTALTDSAVSRICREVATERDLLNLHGTFYELPAENADGFAKVRPVATHNLAIHDYASYRGLLVMSGVNDTGSTNPRIVRSQDGRAAVWAGTIDDLWELGKPVGEGGPWKDSRVEKGVPSDPYLIGFYDKKHLRLSHSHTQPVTVRIEADPIGDGPWMTYREIVVNAGQTVEITFPSGFQARWIRFVSDRDCMATAWLVYE